MSGVKVSNVNIRIQFFNKQNNLMFLCNNLHSYKKFQSLSSDDIIELHIPSFPLGGGNYYVNLRCRANGDLQDDIENAFSLSVEDGDFFKTGKMPSLKDGVLVAHKWNII